MLKKENNILSLYLSDNIHSEIDLNALNSINLNSISGVNGKFPTEVTYYDIPKMISLSNAISDFADNVESKDVLGHGCYLLFIPGAVNIDRCFDTSIFTPKLHYKQDTLSFDNEVGSIGSIRLISNRLSDSKEYLYSYFLSLKTFELFMDKEQDDDKLWISNAYKRCIIKLKSTVW